MNPSPNARSLNLLRENGYCAKVVERFNSFTKQRIDLWGMDIVAVKKGKRGVLGVQATTSVNVSSRIKKLNGIPELKVWAEAGNAVQVWGWRKGGKRGKRKIWMVKRTPIFETLPVRLQHGKL